MNWKPIDADVKVDTQYLIWSTDGYGYGTLAQLHWHSGEYRWYSVEYDEESTGETFNVTHYCVITPPGK